jgi:hypothetical protein
MSSATVSLHTFDQVLQLEITCFASEHVHFFCVRAEKDEKSHAVVFFCRVHASEPEPQTLAEMWAQEF